MMREQTHQSGKNEKGLVKQEADLAKSELDLENLTQRHATYAQIFATELARFHRTKCENITELFRSYAQLNIDFYQSVSTKVVAPFLSIDLTRCSLSLSRARARSLTHSLTHSLSLTCSIVCFCLQLGESWTEFTEKTESIDVPKNQQ